MRHRSPRNPASMDWTSYYPAYATSETASPLSGTTDTSPTPIRQLTKAVTIADIGCGFGGLLVALAKILPEELLLGKHSCSFLLLTQADALFFHRTRTPHTSHGLCPRSYQRPPRSRSTPLPEYSLPTCQYHEVPSELLHAIPAQQNLSLLSGSALQSTEAQGKDCVGYSLFGVRLCVTARRLGVYDHGCGGTASVDGGAFCGS